MKTVFIVLFHWGYDGDNGVEYYHYENYNDAYDKFQELIYEEINHQWIGNCLAEDGSPLEGYTLDSIDRDGNETDLWWNFYEDGYGNENFTNIDLKKVEVL
ncbi:MAG: hypothetical protein IJ398_04285 [Clostridia bacterium]|nr:hypothetical protein [Clostridia bacterium]